MNKKLLEKLLPVSEEEKMLLAGNKLNPDLYTNRKKFSVDSGKLLSAGKYITVRTHTRFTDFPLHNHNYIEIMYVYNGNITHVIDGNEITMQKGDILFMNQQVRHSIKRAEKEDIGINFIILPDFFEIPLSMIKNDKENFLWEFLLGALRINSSKPQYLHFKTHEIDAIENLMENIISSLLLEEKNNENIIQFTMGLIFLYLLNNIDSIDEDSLQGGNDIMAEAAIRYIKKRYKDASLNELSKSMHQTPSNMSKIIKKSTGSTFLEHLQKIRLKKASVLLSETNMTVQEIMNAVGYENSSYFYNIFKDEFGVSPRKYRIDNSKINEQDLGK